MAGRYRVEPLAAEHNRSAFQSGSEPLDRYLREQASQDIRRNIANCFVAVTTDTGELAGYFTLAAISIPLDRLPAELIRKLPRYPVVPAALLGRLAIASDHQGQGLGAALLADALLRISRADLAVFAMVVDAKDVSERAFYEHHGFTVLADSDNRLYLPIATALRASKLRV